MYTQRYMHTTTIMIIIIIYNDKGVLAHIMYEISIIMMCWLWPTRSIRQVNICHSTNMVVKSILILTILTILLYI